MTYDAMSNLSAATESTCQTYDQNGNCLTWGSPLALASAAYSLAGQLTTLNFNNFSITGPYPSPWFQTETHSYNSMLQLTNITTTTTNPSGAQVNMTYTYSATQNNGRIVSSSDAITGENVSYTYDSLNRLIGAATTGTTGVQWGDSYSYDGFGNLTSKVATKGTAPQVYPQVDSTTNRARMNGDYGFDANGNWLGTPGPPALVNTWNVENQLISNGAQDGFSRLYTYTYDPWGKRVLQYATGGAYGPTGTLYFYSITGQRLGTYSLQHLVATQVSANMFFGGRMLVAMDRLGSVRNKGGANIAYFPWGEERTSTQDGTDKFATYFRDGQFEDYASARYYNNNFGRFWSVDPSGLKAANPKNPTSWNLYAYSTDDPANNRDPTGTTCIPVNGTWADDGTGCGYVGQPVSTYGSFSSSSSGQAGVTTTITFYCAPGTTGSDCSDQDIYGWLGLGQQVLQEVGQLLNSVSVGGFVFAPLAEASVGPAAGSVLLVQTMDSNTGTSTSALAEVGAADVAVGYEQGLSNNNGDTLVLAGALPGNGTGIDFGLVASPVTGTFGFYLGIGDFGVGGYISLGGEPIDGGSQQECVGAAPDCVTRVDQN